MESSSYGTMPIIPSKVSPKRETWSQLVAINVNNVLLLSNGMAAGYATILIPGLLSDNDKAMVLTETEISWIGSLSYMCSIIGCFLSGMITQPIGRTRAVHLVCPFLFASLLIFKFATQMWHIYVALCLCGCLVALIDAPMLSYKAEICQPHLRGMLSATSTVSVITGVLLQFILGTFFHWRTVAVISSSLPFIGFILLFFIPESPHWLIMHNKIDKAQRSLAWLRGWTTIENVEEEFQQMWNNYKEVSSYESFKVDRNTQTSEKFDWKQSLLLYVRKNFLWPLGLVSFLFFLANFTGICTLQTYAVSIFGTLQAPMDNYYATVTLGVTQVVGSFLSLFVVKYFGKRVMGFVSVLGLAFCNAVVGIYAFMIKAKYLIFEVESDNSLRSDYAWVPLCTLIAMAFIGHVGIRVLPWILLSEIFPHETRAMGCGIGSAIFYLIAFLANKVFLRLTLYLQFAGVCWFYAAISVFGFIIMYFFLPETEGKDLQDVINHFAEISQLDDKVKREIKTNPKSHTSHTIKNTVEDKV
ncbi:hypothetical protein RN001_008716 [Aquatica leii]|uniref:Major facilitator superfamily (MFS) profile domain-containing protein n=1 Tax=Aquatica leii TaxID=1421715 RepID=A0AAN7P4M0_9COLE|nr:hypothetical protein RN001_008716 [Aquatica leii]